ncbi:MAG: ABC transporter permease, partial [Erysipelotrichaceae bacterium]|nr:ABC transporter permease [Erysipelotrichaceae bacterium]
MFDLETLRLIKKTFRRFLALTLIVLIGSGFMMGLSSSSDVLRKSVDDYYDQTLMQDLQVYSSYGFCREDYDFISKIEGVKDVFASKTIDCNGSSEGGEDTVFRVSELIRKVNNYELLSGRMPVKNDECILLADNDFKYYEVGQKIKLDYGENDIHDYLKNDEFTIVGTFKSPEYMAKILGPSNFNNKDLQAVIFIPNANFIFDYYTTMYVTLEDAGKLVSYTDKYDRFIETQKASFENEIYPQQAYLRDRLVKEAKEELAEKEELFNKLKTDGQKELDDAKAMLDEAAMQIASYEAQISMLEMTARSLQAAVNQDKPILEEIYGNTAQAENDINQILESLGLPGDYHYATSIMSYTRQAYEQIISQLYSARYQLNAGKAQYQEGLKEYQEGLVSFNKQIADGELQLRLAKQKVEELPKAKWMVFDRSMQYSALMYKNT